MAECKVQKELRRKRREQKRDVLTSLPFYIFVGYTFSYSQQLSCDKRFHSLARVVFFVRVFL
jgi:hypothetical protein